MVEVWSLLGWLAISWVRYRRDCGSASGAAGEDIRATGSGRTGATNTFRALGIRWSVTVLVLDGAQGRDPHPDRDADLG